MKIDCHSHLWDASHLSDLFIHSFQDNMPHIAKLRQLPVTPDEHWSIAQSLDKMIVFGLQANYCGVWVPNKYVADYVNRDRKRLIGFASVDPSTDGYLDEFENAIQKLGLQGLKLGPVYQNFDPRKREYFPLFEQAQEWQVPIIWHQGSPFMRGSILSFANPIYLDLIAREFPSLPMIIAHMGTPWIDETIMVMRNNEQVYADISMLTVRPWHCYNAIRLANECGVARKLLFGSDYPFNTPEETAEGLKKVNEVVSQTNIPKIPTQIIEMIIHENTQVFLKQLDLM